MTINAMRLGRWIIHFKCTLDYCGDDGAQWFTTGRDNSRSIYCRCDTHLASDSSGYTLFNSLEDVKAHIAMREL